MKAIHWEQKDDFNCWEHPDVTMRCESCGEVIIEGYLIGAFKKDEAKKLHEKLNENPIARDIWDKMICLHPDSVLLCENCLKDKFIFKRKIKKPFGVRLMAI